MNRTALLLAAATFACGGPAAAQISIDSGMGATFDGATAMQGTVLQQQVLRNAMGSTGRRIAPTGAPGARYASAPPSAGGPAAAVRAGSTRYAPTPAVSARVKAQYLDHIAKTVSPQAASAYRGALDRGNFVQSWSRLVADDGLRPGDAAEAFAGYWILNYIIANQLTSTNPAHAQAVVRQARATMATEPAFTRLSEAQRQELAEVLMLNFLTQHAGYTRAVQSNDAGLKRRLADAAVTRFRNEMGVDLRRLQLTSGGFVRRG